jgi:Ser/Thr protein kinase RdoA (MazF antagonist)
MSAPPPAGPEGGTCLLCHATFERLAVTTEGDLLGCDRCTKGPAETDLWRTAAEWEASDAVSQALTAFGIGPHSLSRTAHGLLLRPRAHVWFVTTGGRTLMLKRQDNAPGESAVRFEGALRAQLAAALLPVAAFLPTRDGATIWTDAHAAHWTLHEAPRGVPFASYGELWGLAGNIGGMLAKLHATMRPLVASETPTTSWQCWTLDSLRAHLADWPSMTQLTHELRDRAIDRLVASRIFETLKQLPQTIAHGNFGRAAIYRDTFGPTGICEFERAHPEAALCDFAFGLVNQFRPVVRAAVKAYERERPLEEAERHALPEVLLLGSLIRADRQLTVWHDSTAADRYGLVIAHLLDHSDELRRLDSSAKPSTPT